MPDLAIATTSRRTGVSSGHTMANGRTKRIQGQARDTVEVPYMYDGSLETIELFRSLLWTSFGRGALNLSLQTALATVAELEEAIGSDAARMSRSRLKSTQDYVVTGSIVFVPMLDEQRCEDRRRSMNKLKLTTIRTSRHVITGTSNIATH